MRVEAGPVVEGGPDVADRWVGSGWIVFNNKGKPVREYEPFFSATHRFQFAVTVGVSPVLFYDPVERVVATLHPNHTYDKVEFDPWRQASWDVNDTVLLDPATDDDIRRLVARFLAAQPAWETWYERRQGGALGDLERAAAEKTAVHGGTPTLTYLDGLGRPFLTVQHDRRRDDGTTTEALHATEIRRDIEGNEREVVDAQRRAVVRQMFDMLSSKLRLSTADAGETFTVLDAGGKTIRAWDSRGHDLRISYDALRRPTRLSVLEGGVERLVERTVYGEAHPSAVALNLRTRYHQHYDGGGLVVSEENDFKGNPLRTTRRLVAAYRDVADWSSLSATNDAQLIAAAPQAMLDAQAFTTATAYDALNRAIEIATPDGSVVRPAHNEAGLLERVDVSIRGDASVAFVTDVDYAADGRRVSVDYGNGVRTRLSYDPETSRLRQRLTTRGAAFPGTARRRRTRPAASRTCGTSTTRQATCRTSRTVLSRRCSSTTAWPSRASTTPTTRCIGSRWRRGASTSASSAHRSRHGMTPGECGSSIRMTARRCAATQNAIATTPSATCRRSGTSPPGAAGHATTSTKSQASSTAASRATA